ncbi:ABC-type multidrug transport system, ATPase component [Thioflavicoccus mobilis 8321]|uniref:ABC-type multidrug transport system, ATPase component n=1 Tax=Thioflavicoccus mobilis 8321 TaxID=765912 RepID=L0GY64_9GAMM|nr:ATP-binding cassette domain-containing protein [Thioflavicoccus mobilis]AGA90320.1 ABC-type multidrug transport system, ATPase component [Thioflavicoccus mobilis 8321]
MQQLELRTSRRSVAQMTLSNGGSCTIGSEAANQVILSGAGVRGVHAHLRLSDGRVCIEPEGDAKVLVNGTIAPVATAVGDGDWIAFGDTLLQIRLPRQEAQGGAKSQEAVTLGADARGGEMVVGRLAGCDLPIDSPLISREHARLSLQPDGVYIEDLKSTNGTWVNGRRIDSRVLLQAGDRVSFASFVFVFTGYALEPAEVGNRVRVEARGLSKTVRDRTTKQARNLLTEIDLAINPGEFVVIFGTSGSGKSTLLDALNGRRPASTGQIAYNGVDLYRSFDLFRSGIGYVPQQDIVHRKIKVRNALRYTARLRLPPDTSRQEIDENIDRVLERVDLTEKADLAVDTPEPLSGGQLKRVSLAVELVANPNVLFLDEATSGLDAGTDKKMMRLFAGLAEDGKTVICVTHSLENIDACHMVALLHRGYLVYYGPPQDATAHFGVARLSDVYEALEGQDPQVWAERFARSEYHERYVAARLEAGQAFAQAQQEDPAPPAKKPGRKLFDVRQTVTLMRRYADLLLSDRLNLLVLLLQAPLVALVVGAVFDIGGPLPDRAAAESQISFVLVLSAIWFGCINSAREIVKELPVYLRERSVKVKLLPYLLSKLLPLALLCLIQCASFLAIVTLMLGFTGPFLDRLLTLFLAGFAATAMGLAVSAFVDSNDKAIAALPLLLIPQFILSNSVVTLSGVTEVFAQVTVIAYWGIDAMRATLDPALLALAGPKGTPLIQVTGEWLRDVLYLVAQAVAFLAITLIGLKLKDRKV